SSTIFMASTVHRLSPSMQDFDPTAGGNVFAEADPSNPTTVFLITWQAVPCFNTVSTGLTSTFQVALIDNGTNDTCEYRYVTLTNDSVSNAGVAITGFTPGPGSVNPGNRDLTAGLFSTATPEQLPLGLSVSPRPIINTPVTFTTSNVPAPG